MSILNHLYRLPAKLRYWKHTLLDNLVRPFGDREQSIRFRCNICGRRSQVSAERLTREEASCACGSSVRLRALVHMLTTELFRESHVIPDMPCRKDLVGLDMSGAATYADGLAKRLGYTNTFLHKPPRLDITDPDPQWLGRCDFIISSDVFEHVAPPVGRAFDNVLRLLKPGGVFVLTVPYGKTGDTLEHFPELHEYRIEKRGDRRVLINRTTDGREQEFEALVFHGGEGETLEMRVFSEEGVIGELQRAGFVDIRIHGEPCIEYGILWPQDWSLPITARRPGMTV